MISSLAHPSTSSSAEDCVELNSARKKKDPRESRHQDTLRPEMGRFFFLGFIMMHVTKMVQLYNEANKASGYLLYGL